MIIPRKTPQNCKLCVLRQKIRENMKAWACLNSLYLNLTDGSLVELSPHNLRRLGVCVESQAISLCLLRLSPSQDKCAGSLEFLTALERFRILTRSMAI